MAENTTGKRGHTSNSSSSDDEDGIVKPLRKIWCKSGYNLFYAEFSTTTGVLTMCMYMSYVYHCTSCIHLHVTTVSILFST